MSESGNRPQPPAPGIAEGVDRVFRRLLVATMALGVVVAGVFGYVLGSVRPDRHRYHDGAEALDLAHAAMIDQESGLRGYLLTRDPHFLDPYDQGRGAVARQDALLESFLGSDPHVAPLLLEMRVTQQAWTSQWAQPAAQGLAPGPGGALGPFLDEGKSLFDAYRVREEALSATVDSRWHQLDNREGAALGAGLGLAMAFGVVLVLLVGRQRRELRTSLVEPVARIMSATDAIANLDLTTTLEPSGPAELRQIAGGLNVMRDALASAHGEAAAARRQAEARTEHLRSILGMSREIAGSLSLRYVLRSVAETARAVSGFPRAVVWLADEALAEVLTVAYDTDPLDGALDRRSRGAGPDHPPRTELGIGVVGQAVRYGRTTAETRPDEPSVEVHPERPLRSLAIPLVVGARVIGAVEICAGEPHGMREGSLEVLETLASHAAAAIEAARLHGRTEELAQTDALTGLANRRVLDHDLGLECDRAARYGRPLALVMFDVDNFKRYNDELGHLRGDEVLQELAKVVTREVRSTDSVYRYGGEEFAVLCRESRPEQATILAERIRSRVEAHFASHGSLRPVTASFGVSLVPPEEPVPVRVIASADAALYEAKAAGRNRVCCATPARAGADGAGGAS